MKTNKELAKQFEDLATLLELEDVAWKPIAYRNAARSIANYEEDIQKIYKNQGDAGLKNITGIGKNMAEHIKEYLERGKIDKLEKLKKRYPQEIIKMTELEGLGPKKTKHLINKLNIKSTKDLERAIKNKEIQHLDGFAEKTEKNIKESLELHKKKQGRMLLDQATRIAEETIQYLNDKASPEIIDYAGSLRRMKSTIGDIDILAVKDKSDEIMDAFTNMSGIKKVISKGETRSSIILTEDDIHIDLRVIPKESYAAALQYFTGSKAHNIEIRKIALKQGYKLSEYGLFRKKDNKKINIKNEETLYKKIGLQYIPPELRERKGEIELAQKNKIPKLVTEKDIKGDLHIHTTYSEGLDTIEEMANHAAKKGYEYIAITDHSKSRKIAGGLSEDELEKQINEIKKIEKKIKIRILKGTESDILSDGNLDYSDKILNKLDFVIGSVHQNFKMTKKEMTQRLIKAIKNKHLDILGHPTGRLIKKRKKYDADYDKIFQVAAKYNKLIEINSQPKRLDINDELLIKAKEKGAMLCINTDAHKASHLNYMRYGVAQARRAYISRENIANTKNLREFEKIIKQKK